MKLRLSITISIIVFLLVGFTISSVSYAKDYEIMGQEAEDEGKLRKALTHYMKALESASERSSSGLREKIIKLVQEIEPSPAVPEEAHRHMARGEAFIETANDKKSFKRAVKEFQAAALIAPWLADVYYNLGIVQDKAGLYQQAMRSLELYLLAAPDASDARKVRNLIYKIEARQEEARRVKAEDRKREEEARSAKAEERQREEEQRKKKKKKTEGLEALAGIWRQHIGDGRYGDDTYYRYEILGDEILVTQVFESLGKERPFYRFKLEGRQLTGKYLMNNTEATATVSYDFKEIIIQDWREHIGFHRWTYHKCRNTNISSCGK